ncbi:MAG: nucleotidyltransferase domain-containing protein [Candidatus Thiodiazotropha sp. (ex Epidulcina cf. delphinae)]|nr:nucleotidyltransferase domain-containing protein [Candidatus Thiodiazotropha sp. (ex Epidulcina cf. delphinae)]
MMLKPQDILVVLKLVAVGQDVWSYSRLALQLGMSPSEVHSAVKRAIGAGLAIRLNKKIRPHIKNLEEFLLHGIQYVFAPELGGLTWGMATGHATPSLAGHFTVDDAPPPVWPDPEGEVRGEAFSPLYQSVPVAAKNDPKLYELLALVDAIRGGRARERNIAKKVLKQRLAPAAKQKSEPMRNNRDRIVIGEALAISRAALRKLAQHYQIRRLVLFGSAARGELRPDSDIDLLVEFERGAAPSLGGMVEIQDAFAKLFGGRKVDIATPAILKNPYRRHAIEKDMEVLYAA